jgi:hypothetical protein
MKQRKKNSPIDKEREGKKLKSGSSCPGLPYRIFK